jgi:hypothetical protein
LRKLRWSALVAGVVVVAAAVFGGTAASARADYGPGTQFQVEISANDVHGGNFWFWAALGPNQESDYVNTDCIHLTAGGNPGATVGAANTRGSLTGWSDSGGMLEMRGVSIVGGLATANFIISDAPHSNALTVIVTSDPLHLLPPELDFSGRGTQVQVAAHP